MIRLLTTMLAGALLYAMTGCAGQHQDKKTGVGMPQVKVETKRWPLTAQMAKQALLKMDGRQIPPGVIVPMPKDDPIRIVNDDQISIGIYHCNLKDKTFHASTSYPKALRHRFNEISGVFKKNKEGKLVAKVTNSLSAH